ncbi:phospholipase D-like domain-containing protein [Cytobacillus firmus]|uniref:Phospholipase D-like domain-containing protein n=1 Tax=Cytobacillus firmus TaxID=1399 RepID=A0AA46PKG3_CYTFI|nr:phospholipase D-like domain-containing protein [Cytobacillus firmus]KML36380.1 cardiolipin synthase [Cytobacillus firmus]UYG96658.1 phospholipase D-like domain-containing protein [Cytobacillus firmus]
MEWIFYLYLINTFFILIIAIRDVRRPAKALNWIIIVLLLPIIGFLLYLSISNPKFIHRKRLTSSKSESNKLPDTFGDSASVIADSLRHFTVNGLRMGRVQVFNNGIAKYEQLLESLQNAQKTIDLEYFIFRNDQIGNRITELLIEKAVNGVRVRFMRDGLGSYNFPREKIRQMVEAGIECRAIFPLRFPWIFSYWNYRDHCKMAIIDGKIAFNGGINIGYEYTGLNPDVGFWRDTHLQVIGEASADLQTVFDVHWEIAVPERIKSKTKLKTKSEVTKINSIGRADHSKWSAELGSELSTLDDKEMDISAKTRTLHKAYIHTLEGNPGIPTPVIRQAYFICITQATKTIDLTTPYFVPETDIIMALKTAVARGVRVRLLVPRHNNQKIVGLASRTYYGELIEAGVQIYQYDKGMIHAKVLTIDEEIAEVGSANYDMRSFRLHYEVCQVLYSTDVARELTDQFERDLMDSIPLKIEDLLERPLTERIVEQSARLFSPLL